MSKKKVQAITADFDDVWAFLQAKGSIPNSPPAKMVEFARRMHRATYSLILWSFRLKRLPNHSMVFVEEIASDAIQVLPQALMGYGKTTTLLIRGIIENLVRHLYFADHPIEFARMNREHKWFPGMEELFEYPGTHPQLMTREKRFDAVNRLKTLYGELSATVHGRRIIDLEMRTALEKLTFNEGTFEKHVVAAEKVTASVNFLLAVFHESQVTSFQTDDRQIILRSMPSNARRVLKGME